jgi:molecular chaperone GrpE
MTDPVDPVAFEPAIMEVCDGVPPIYPPEDDPNMLPPPPYGLEDPPSTEPQPAPPDGTSPTADPLTSAVERLETAVAAGIAEVLSEFRDKLALDRFKEDQISKLHEELQAYKNDLISRASRQILQGVIRLHDDLGKVAAALRQKPAEELTPERFFQQLEGFQDDVELLLGQHGVERFDVEGEEFDPRRQTALRTISTDDPTQVGRVAERLRPGFVQGDNLIQKERVAVYAANAKA